jgi:hypothetical protein
VALKRAKPEPSKAAAVIEPLKASGPPSKSIFDLDGPEFDRRRREQIRKR